MITWNSWYAFFNWIVYCYILQEKNLTAYSFFAVAVNSFVIGYLMKKGATSFVSRFKLWIIALELVQKSKSALLWGYGYTEGNILFRKKAFIFTEIVEHPHNAYVSLLLMFGLIFLIIFILLMIYLLLHNFIKIYKTNIQSEKLYYNYLFSLLISFLVQGLFELPLYCIGIL